MYTIEFYKDRNGYSEVREWMSDLEVKSKCGDKSARIQLKQLVYVMNRLGLDGTRAGSNYVKRLLQRKYMNFGQAIIALINM